MGWLQLGALSLLLLGCSAPGVRVDDEYSKFADRWNSGEDEVSRYALVRTIGGEVREGEAIVVVSGRPPSDRATREANSSAGIPGLRVVRREHLLHGVGDLDFHSVIHVREASTADASALDTAFAMMSSWGGAAGRRVWHENEQVLVADQAGDLGAPTPPVRLAPCWLEDELFGHLRLPGLRLPTERVPMLAAFASAMPGSSGVEPVYAGLSLSTGGDGEKLLTVEYVRRPRRVVIRFEAEFPHGILGWREDDEVDGKPIVVEAKRTHVRSLPFTQMTERRHESLRPGLGLGTR